MWSSLSARSESGPHCRKQRGSVRADFIFRTSVILSFAFLTLWTAVDRLSGQTPSPSPSILPSPAASPVPSPTTTWRVGFSRLATDGVSDAYVFSSVSIPKTWRIALNFGLRHRVSAEQAEALQLEVDRTAMAAALKTLEVAIDQRDRALLSSGTLSDDKTKTFKTNIDKAIAGRAAYVDLEPLSDELKMQIKMEAEAIRAASPSPSPGSQNDSQKQRGGRGPAKWVADSFAKLEIPAAGQEAELYAAVAPGKRAEMRQVVKKENLQTLVGGRLTESQGYLFLEAFVYDRATDNIVYQEERAFLPSDIEARSAEFLDEIAEAVLSYKGAIVNVKPTSAVFNSRLVGPAESPAAGREEGSGPREWRYLEPGRYRLEYFATGYFPDREDIDIAEGETLVREPTLGLAPYPPVHVETVPPGAELYLQSQFMGLTPLDLEVAGGQTILMLEKEGYRRATVLVDSDKDQKVHVELRRDLIDWDVELSKRRAGFYDALGLFALSLSIPILADGLYRSNYITLYGIDGAALVMTPDELENTRVARIVFDLSRGTGIGISLVAFVDAMIKLDFYLRAADYVAGHQ